MMLPKPRFLTDEVKEFIETNYQTKDVDSPNCLYRWDVREFYNQPFQPEMITKYFKGWNLVSINGADQEPHYSYNNGKAHLWLLSYRIIIEGENPSFTKKTVPPKTLQHFISDCERAELKLEWKND